MLAIICKFKGSIHKCIIKNRQNNLYNYVCINCDQLHRTVGIQSSQRNLLSFAENLFGSISHHQFSAALSLNSKPSVELLQYKTPGTINGYINQDTCPGYQDYYSLNWVNS